MIDLDASLDELRLVYRVLKDGLTKFPDLMDCNFFDQLQTFLQSQATEDGVDVADHAAWVSWLSGEEPEPASPEWGVN